MGRESQVGKATLNRIQTEIMGEETMSNQKKLSHDVRLTGVNSRALEGRAPDSSLQGPESFWNHCAAPGSKRSSPVLLPLLGIMQNCEFLCYQP